MKRALALLLALALVLSGLTGCSRRPAETVAEDIITRFGATGGAEDAELDRLLRELRSVDRRQGELWSGIVDYWRYVNADMEVRTDGLPGDLPRDDSLCIVVLGYALNADGTMRPELLDRLTTALACAGQYPEARVLCTGGGTAGRDSDATEAGRMGEWLLANGLAPERLSVEDKSMSTAENAAFSCQLLLRDWPRVDSVVIVTSSYHVPWGALLFEAAFRIAAAENGAREIHVVSNCACPVVSAVYGPDEILRRQTGGLLQLVGDDSLAMKYYMSETPGPLADSRPGAGPSG